MHTTLKTVAMTPCFAQFGCKWFITLALLFVLTPMAANAHEIRPIILDTELNDNGQIQWVARLNLEAALSGISPEHEDTDEDPNNVTYIALRAQSEDALTKTFNAQTEDWLNTLTFTDQDGNLLNTRVTAVDIEPAENDDIARDTLITGTTEFPTGSNAFTIQWNDRYAPVIVRYTDDTDETQNTSSYVLVNEASPTISVRVPKPPQSAMGTFVEYIKVGFVHILPLGLDHIVFVLGIVLLHPFFKPVLLQVTLFTVAHSLTLALVQFGLISVPGRLVEAAIALSIVFIGLDNLKPKPIGVLRTIIVFGFGLLHGLGFANVLGELDVGASDPLIVLAGFNIGVEIGQLVVVALFFVLIGYWMRNRKGYGRFVRIPASLALAAVGLYWFIERTVM